ncbi:MAG TPA: VOC family protein [Candidatus Eremiobacteraceae bacterium]|nr:VOC family protein [Candidatus Eremiobacteraceae bacterium]
MPIQLGPVGHFSLAVRDPKKSARWWTGTMGLREQFKFRGGIAVGNDAVTIALFKGVPRPGALEHMSFHLASAASLRRALAHLRREHADMEDPGDEIGPEAPGSKNIGLWLHDPDGYRWELSVLAKPPKETARRKKRKV